MDWLELNLSYDFSQNDRLNTLCWTRHFLSLIMRMTLFEGRGMYSKHKQRLSSDQIIDYKRRSGYTSPTKFSKFTKGIVRRTFKHNFKLRYWIVP
jgi:hypothetical protein